VSKQSEDQGLRRDIAFGKISRDFFQSVIYPNLGKSRNEVLVGPSSGVDTCVVKIATNEVLVSTTDPVSYIAELGPMDSAWLSVNLIASDLSTSGFHPQYAIFELNLPPSIPDSQLEDYWKGISSECEHLGISIIGGHTGRFEGLNSTVIGGGTMFSVGSSNKYLTSGDASIGDRIIVTKSAAVASTGILSKAFPRYVSENIGEDLFAKASDYFRRTSVVNDALTAVKAGVRSEGVSAMHDATEGGVLSAIYELASASSLGARVDVGKIPVSEETREICRIFDMDPFVSLGEGALVIACHPSRSPYVISLLAEGGISAADVGVLVSPDLGIFSVNEDRETPIKYPVTDPYWNAYYQAKHRKLK
jgi:hydrogenase expression/formation protein HypE